MTHPLRELVVRLREHSSREGKPSGKHMIDGQRAIAKAFATHGGEEWQQIGEVADCMAHCIENEALLFECLATPALEAATAIESLLDEVEGLRAIKTAAQAVKAQGTLPQGRLRSSKCVIPASSWHQLCAALSSDAGER